MVSITIKHGYLWRVLGQPVQHNGFIFVPVLGELYNGIAIRPYRREEEAPMFPLTDYLGNQVPKLVKSCRTDFTELVDAVWVRARIPAIFGFTPLSLPFPDYKYALIEQMFVACEQCSVNGDWLAYPFICEDYDLRVGLRFSPDPLFIETYERIAKAFWELLLLEPENVQPFCDAYLHYDELFEEEWLIVVFKDGECIVEPSECDFLF
ncbi:hypothetical protein [Nostoc sp. 106C]|uniref:hypothetical protein n=1 Tax=Nostoc sp. 106C TaxID=1932667 RepID=UPI000A3BD242|nr:hypothetical protein [Nostoc sp. 106C]OUL32141.1 hypothetical protein BV375_10860 [Nostoc sp. 106C]